MYIYTHTQHTQNGYVMRESTYFEEQKLTKLLKEKVLTEEKWIQESYSP